MTKTEFSDLTIEEKAKAIADEYGSNNNLSLEQRKIIADFIYEYDLVFELSQEMEFDKENDSNKVSYEDSIDFIPHYDNARF